MTKRQKKHGGSRRKGKGQNAFAVNSTKRTETTEAQTWFAESRSPNSGSTEATATAQRSPTSTSNGPATSSIPNARSFEENLRGAFRRPSKQKSTQQSRSRRASTAASNDVYQIMQEGLIQAAMRGDLLIGLKLFAMGVDPNHVMEDGRTALHGAASFDQLQFIRLLLSHGASVNLKDGDCKTPIQVAAHRERIKTVKLLIEHGADINASGEHDTTPLMFAASGDSPAAIRLLVQHNANVNATAENGWTALHFAAEESAFNSAKALIDCHADLNVFDQIGLTPLHLAIKNKEPRMAELLLKAGAQVNIGRQPIGKPLRFAVGLSGVEDNINAKRNVKLLLDYGGTSFHGWTQEELFHTCCGAVSEGYTELAVTLLEAGCPNRIHDPSEPIDVSILCVAALEDNIKVGDILLKRYVNDRRELAKAVQAAALNGSAKFLEMLFSRGTDPNGEIPYTESRRTPLHFAIIANGPDNPIRESAIDVLVKFGVDPNKKDNGTNRNSPLHDAAFLGKTDGIRRLLKMGAEIEARNATGETPLIVACVQDELSAAKVLIEEGDACISIQAFDGASALYVAALNGHVLLMKYLLSKGAPINDVNLEGVTPLLEAVRRSEVEAVKELLDHGADSDMRDDEGESAIHVAITKQTTRILKLCLEAGANVSQRNSDNMTPVSIACSLNNLDALKLLLQFGADVNDVQNPDKTPLIVAVEAEANHTLLECLLANGADVNGRNSRYETPLHLAASDDAADVVELLLRHGADKSLRDRNARTPLDFARLGSNSNAIRELIKERHESTSHFASGQSRDSKQKNTAGKKADTDPLIDEMKKSFSCPITLEMMKDPVVAADGHSYERSAIETWFQTSLKSPVTGQHVRSIVLVPNWNLKQQIESFRANTGMDT